MICHSSINEESVMLSSFINLTKLKDMLEELKELNDHLIRLNELWDSSEIKLNQYMELSKRATARIAELLDKAIVESMEDQASPEW